MDYTNPILSPEANSRIYLEADSGYNASKATSPEETVWTDQAICFAEIKKHCRGGESILDFGCGEGGFVYLCTQGGLEARGIEFNSQAVARATSLGIQHIDSLTLSELSDAAFDIIVAIHVLEHLDDLGPIVQAFRRLLKPAGKVAVIVPNYRSLKISLCPLLYWDNPYIHLNGLSAAKLDRVFSKFHFSRVALRAPWSKLGGLSYKDRLSMLLTTVLGNWFNVYPTKLLLMYQLTEHSGSLSFGASQNAR